MAAELNPYVQPLVDLYHEQYQFIQDSSNSGNLSLREMKQPYLDRFSPERWNRLAESDEKRTKLAAIMTRANQFRFDLKDDRIMAIRKAVPTEKVRSDEVAELLTDLALGSIVPGQEIDNVYTYLVEKVNQVIDNLGYTSENPRELFIATTSNIFEKLLS